MGSLLEDGLSGAESVVEFLSMSVEPVRRNSMRRSRVSRRVRVARAVVCGSDSSDDMVLWPGCDFHCYVEY